MKTILTFFILAACLSSLLAACQPTIIQGQVGPQGAAGLQGPAGPQGIQGPKGDKGDPGNSSGSSILVTTRPSTGENSFGPVRTGVPKIHYADGLDIYGAGFKDGEKVSFRISDGGHSFEIGSITIQNVAGVFDWNTKANWPNYNWTESAEWFGSIKAEGNQGSIATAFVGIWAR